MAHDIVTTLGCHNDDPGTATINSALDLFCALAVTQKKDHHHSVPALQEQEESFHSTCSAASRESLWQVWNTIRQTVAAATAMGKPKDDDATTTNLIITTALQQAKPMTPAAITHHKGLTLWVPRADQGVSQVLRELQQQDYGEFISILQNDNKDDRRRLFVDGGSNLGFVTLLVALETDADILSIEAASPTWIMQQLNLVCNLSSQRLSNVHSQLAALGGTDDDGTALQLQWRPTSTITVRGWDEKDVSRLRSRSSTASSPLSFTTPVRTLRGLLSQIYGSAPHPVDVFKIDCEGCEYNVIPDLTTEELESIHTMIGEIHYGFIPLERAPSKQRAETTHQRLCEHVNFVDFAKECCQFPNQMVKHLQIPIHQVKGNQALCADFDTWSANNKLLEDRDETGWRNVGKA